MRHLSDEELFESFPVDENGEIAVHLSMCEACSKRANEIVSFLSLIREVIGEAPAPVIEEEMAALVDRIRADADAFQVEERNAALTLTELRVLPVTLWSGYFLTSPSMRSYPMVEALFNEATSYLDTRPERTLEILDVAENVARALNVPPGDAHVLASLNAKNRANALRMLGRYEEALEAAESGERLAADAVSGGFAFAQAVYTRGTVLFKMGRFDEALEAARTAGGRFGEYGSVRPAAHALILEAACLIEKGEMAEGARINRLAISQLDVLGDAAMAAQLRANTAVIQLRLGNLEQARASAEEAQQRFRQLGIRAEEIRTEWTLGAIDLAQGRVEEARARLEDAARAFDDLNMVADGAFVRTTYLELLVADQEWEEAVSIASNLAEVFGRAGADVLKADAVSWLRKVVMQREATPSMVRRVREYLQSADSEPFVADVN